MEKIRVLIIDDEPLAREGISLLIKADSQLENVGECANGRQAIGAIDALSPDLIFLDVQMPEMNGFEMLAHLEVNHSPIIIFVTAYDQYAVQAFETQALDYLLKPFSDERFYKSLERAKAQIEQRRVKEQQKKLQALLAEYEQGQKAKPVQANQTSAEARYIDRLMVKSGARIVFLKTEEIDWIEAADYYVLLHTGNKSHLLREALTELESKLDPQKFVRIHRSTIINVDRVKELQMQGSGDYVVILDDGEKLKLSRRRREKLQLRLKELA